MTEIPPEAVEAAAAWLGGDKNWAAGILGDALPHIEQAIRADERRATVEAIAEWASVALPFKYNKEAFADAIAREFGHKED